VNIRAILILVLALLTFPVLVAASEDSPFYGEIYLNDYRGGGSYTSQEAYVEYSLFADDLAVWGNGYHDQWDNSILYAGLSKTWDSGWTVALGAGQARFDGVTQNVIAPWISYSSEEWEFFLSGERYQGDEDPWFYQGYLQRYVGRHLIGLYAEKDFGIGPVATWNISDHLALRVAVPLADRSNTDWLAALIINF
jgi:hypothetical protein